MSLKFDSQLAALQHAVSEARDSGLLKDIPENRIVMQDGGFIWDEEESEEIVITYYLSTTEKYPSDDDNLCEITIGTDCGSWAILSSA